jgi:pheromone shutdown protein TraB
LGAGGYRTPQAGLLVWSASSQKIGLSMVVRIVGTGHILSKSVEEVRRAIQEDTPDMVAVELDFKRFHALDRVGFDPGPYRGGLKDLLASLVGGGSFPVLLEGVLGLIQKELGEKYGIYPGSDMCAAIVSARDSGCRISLVDRDIEITMNHLMQVPLKEIIQLFLSREEDVEITSLLLDGNIEGILEKDALEAIMARLKEKLPVTFIESRRIIPASISWPWLVQAIRRGYGGI